MLELTFEKLYTTVSKVAINAKFAKGFSWRPRFLTAWKFFLALIKGKKKEKYDTWPISWSIGKASKMLNESLSSQAFEAQNSHNLQEQQHL